MTTPEDFWVTAQTIYGEARGEPYCGMQAVSAVIWNRVFDSRWPASFKEVCQQKWQFSCWNEGDPNASIIRERFSSDPMGEMCLNAALNPLGGLKANHYLANWLIEKGKAPKWYDPKKVEAVIGGHTFLAL